MRVLLTAPSLDPEFGGPAIKLRALRAALADLGADADIIAASRHVSSHAIRARLRYHGTPLPLRLDRVARAVRHADVVHVLGYRDPIGTMAALACRRSRVPYVIEPTGMFRRRFRSLRLKRVFDRFVGCRVVEGARFVITTSEAEAKEIRHGVPAARVVVRPNGIDLAAYATLPPRGAFRRSLGIPANAVVALSLGRMTRKKGLAPLIQATARVADLWLVVAGPDDRDGTVGMLRPLAEEVGERVRVLPRGLFGPEKLQALADADLFCLYSMSENFGSAAAEAAAAGVPTLVSDQCGVAEWLADGLEVVRYGDMNALADRLRALAADPERRARLAKRGRETTRALAWRSVAAAQLELYQRALAER